MEFWTFLTLSNKIFQLRKSLEIFIKICEDPVCHEACVL